MDITVNGPGLDGGTEVVYSFVNSKQRMKCDVLPSLYLILVIVFMYVYQLLL